MTIRKITEYPETVLADVGKPVTDFDQALAVLCGYVRNDVRSRGRRPCGSTDRA